MTKTIAKHVNLIKLDGKIEYIKINTEDNKNSKED